MKRAELKGRKMRPRRKVDRSRGIIISYPGSGLNWVRYCIEHFGGRRTPGVTRLIKGGPIAVYRTHNVKKAYGPNSLNCRFFNVSGRPIHEKAVLLLRDYRESFVRGKTKKDGAISLPTAEKIEAGKVGGFRNYFTNLRAFDEFGGPKLLVRYEEMVRDFSKIEGILDFLGIEYDLSDFDLDHHRERSIEIFSKVNRTLTRGDLLNGTFHRSNASEPVMEALERFAKENYADLFERYLR